ncbi:MAG: hypothetical protein M3273_02320 [Actinomycetota bacterium]|nr:hypothetical protein [Actinomycetota bacterium]
MKVRDPDGDVWDVRLVWMPPLPPLPRFRPKAQRAGSLGPPYGVAESHYRLELRGSVFFSLLVVWPFLLLAHLLVNVLLAVTRIGARALHREPWTISASRKGRERASSLRFAAVGFLRARSGVRQVAAALAAGRGTYEIEGIRLLDEPLFDRRRQR